MVPVCFVDSGGAEVNKTHGLPLVGNVGVGGEKHPVAPQLLKRHDCAPAEV